MPPSIVNCGAIFTHSAPASTVVTAPDIACQLHAGATTEQPAESVNWPPVHLPAPEQCLLLQPPLLTTSRPSLLTRLVVGYIGGRRDAADPHDGVRRRAAR